MSTKVKKDELDDVTPCYVNAFKRLDSVTVRVRDFGEGLDLMDEEDLKHVRKQFLQVEAKMRRYQDQLNRIRALAETAKGREPNRDDWFEILSMSET